MELLRGIVAVPVLPVTAAVRPPFLPISDDERRTIRRLLVHAGLLPA